MFPNPPPPGRSTAYGAGVEVTLPALVTLDLPGLPPPARLTDLPLSLAVAAHLLAALAPPPPRLSAATSQPPSVRALPPPSAAP